MPYSGTDPTAPLYTVIECREKIVELDSMISTFLAKPTVASVEGVGSVSQSGKLDALRKERETWKTRLAEAVAYENPTLGSSMQGPRQILE